MINIRNYDLGEQKAIALACTFKAHCVELQDITERLYQVLDNAICDPDGFDYMIGLLYYITSDMQAITSEINEALSSIKREGET